MHKRYIEIIACGHGRKGIYREPEIDGDPYAVLASHHAPLGTGEAEDVATAIQRSAAELAEVFNEAVLETDLWKAKVWRADWYDVTHAASERTADGDRMG